MCIFPESVTLSILYLGYKQLLLKPNDNIVDKLKLHLPWAMRTLKIRILSWTYEEVFKGKLPDYKIEIMITFNKINYYKSIYLICTYNETCMRSVNF